MTRKTIIGVIYVSVCFTFWAVLGYLILHPVQRPTVKTSFVQRVNNSPESVVSKPRYRYSLVPGGANSLLGMRNQVFLDPTLQKAFAGFDWDRAHEFTFQNGISVFMQFRVGNTIRWTRKTVFVPAGTLAFTDGTKTILARCGNLVAWTPQEPSEEIIPGVLETPVMEPIPDVPVLTPSNPPTPILTASVPPAPVPIGIVPTFPLVPLVPIPIFPRTPMPTPEPSPLLYVISGLFFILLASRIKL